MSFDYIGAIKEGHSPEDISSFLNDKYGMDFDVSGAMKEGYSNSDIHDYVSKNTEGGEETPIQKEMRILSSRKLKYDQNKTPIDIVKSVSLKTGIDPSLLYSSAFSEGMNKAINNPDDISEAYHEANKKGELKGFPVDGFYNYGVDTFGDKMDVLKGYLPEGFESRYKLFKAYNEKGQEVTTAAFKTNEDALVAKAAFLKSEQDNVLNYTARNGINLDERALKYFTLAAYNSGFPNAQAMIDEYVKSKNKDSYIDKGLTKYKSVHKNIMPRMENLKLAEELLNK